MPDYADVPERVLVEMRRICAELPEAYEDQPWAGARWRIRKRTFAHVLTLDSPNGLVTVMTFRSEEPELGVLRRAGHPFFWPGWGHNTVGMVFDASTDWTEVEELVTDSYCVMAPKKLRLLVRGEA